VTLFKAVRKAPIETAKDYETVKPETKAYGKYAFAQINELIDLYPWARFNAFTARYPQSRNKEEKSMAARWVESEDLTFEYSTLADRLLGYESLNC